MNSSRILPTLLLPTSIVFASLWHTPAAAQAPEQRSTQPYRRLARLLHKAPSSPPGKRCDFLNR